MRIDLDADYLGCADLLFVDGLRLDESLLFLPPLRFFSTRRFQAVCNAPVSVSSSVAANRMWVTPFLPQPP